jgi:hypothetical protein
MLMKRKRASPPPVLMFIGPYSGFLNAIENISQNEMARIPKQSANEGMSLKTHLSAFPTSLVDSKLMRIRIAILSSPPTAM